MARFERKKNSARVMLVIERCKKTVMPLPLDSINQVDSCSWRKELPVFKFIHSFIHLFLIDVLQSFAIFFNFFPTCAILVPFRHIFSISVLFCTRKQIFYGFLLSKINSLQWSEIPVRNLRSIMFLSIANGSTCYHLEPAKRQ